MLVPTSVPEPQLYQDATDLNFHEYFWGSAEPVSVLPNPQQAAAGLSPNPEALGRWNPGWQDSGSPVAEIPPASTKVKVELSSLNPGEGEKKAGRRPKARTVFTQEQLWALRQHFHRQHYLTPLQIQQVAATLGLTAKQVKTWFQNRRMKLKRLHKDDVWLDQASWITQVPNYGDPLPSSQEHLATSSCAQSGTTFTQSTNYNCLQVNYSAFPSSPASASQHSPYYPMYNPVQVYNPQARQEQTSTFSSSPPLHFSGPDHVTLCTRQRQLLEQGDLGVSQFL
uniref:Homeobox protein NANOG-like n=1 Tax=Geotrypetes seraphini TaxID=260995 RepID=A0A6P8Q1L5_GEOSA|nr:homeobox protein NANOG-like [Geotrypetes seraphini]